jgi:S-(hydroxymethyl)glutathione dehydrogenase/alcohol dehydrogenase
MTQGAPKYLKAAVLEELCKPLIIRELEIPTLQYGQVLVKIMYSGICRSQLMEVKGGRGEDPWIPHLLGHEGSGIVIALGNGVTKVSIGDQVILGWIRGDGIDAEGARFKCGDKVVNSGKVTTFSNYTIVSESRIIKKPQDLPFDQAVLYGCALPTGAGMVLNELNIDTTKSAVVVGLGGIGIAALLALKAIGVELIIAIDVATDKLNLAKKIGANYVFNSNEDGMHSSVINLTDGGADYCIESAGSVATIEMGFSLIRKSGGKLVFASHPSKGKMIQLDPHELISGKKISGTWGGACKPDIDIPKLHSIIRNSDISLGSLITKTYSLEQINDAFNDLELGKVFRPLIVMSH